MLEWMENRDRIERIRQEREGFFVVAFCGEFSDAS